MQRLTREGAKLLQRRRQSSLTDWSLRPLPAGCGGCPFRCILAVLLVQEKRSEVIGGKILSALLQRWPAPEDWAVADRDDLATALLLLRNGRARARNIRGMVRAWVGEEWRYLADLPGAGKQALEAVEMYCL